MIGETWKVCEKNTLKIQHDLSQLFKKNAAGENQLVRNRNLRVPKKKKDRRIFVWTMLRLKGIIFEQILSDNFSRPTLLNQRRWLRKKSYLKNRHCKIVRLKMFDKTQIWQLVRRWAPSSRLLKVRFINNKIGRDGCTFDNRSLNPIQFFWFCNVYVVCYKCL